MTIIRVMFGKLTAENASNVVIISCSGFTRDALSFAENKPIEVIGVQGNLGANNESLKPSINLSPTSQLKPKTLGNQLSKLSQYALNVVNNLLCVKPIEERMRVVVFGDVPLFQSVGLLKTQ